MWVFVDDSGDAGMKLDRGSSRYIVMSACIFRDPLQIEALKTRSEALANHHGQKPEFKYSKTKKKLKHQYFDSMRELDFSVRIIWADKATLYSPRLTSDGSSLKAYLIKMLLERNWGTIRNAKVVVDGHDLAAFGVPDQQYLMGLVNKEAPGTIHSVKFDDSSRNRAIQLADMTAGATYCLLENAKVNPSRHFDTFRHRTWRRNGGTMWNFK